MNSRREKKKILHAVECARVRLSDHLYPILRRQTQDTDLTAFLQSINESYEQFLQRSREPIAILESQLGDRDYDDWKPGDVLEWEDPEEEEEIIITFISFGYVHWNGPDGTDQCTRDTNLRRVRTEE